MQNSRKSFTIRLVLSAVLIALATGLSNIKIYNMPLGGSVTLMSMVPVVLISVMYGLKMGRRLGVCLFAYPVYARRACRRAFRVGP